MANINVSLNWKHWKRALLAGCAIAAAASAAFAGETWWVSGPWGATCMTPDKRAETKYTPLTPADAFESIRDYTQKNKEKYASQYVPEGSPAWQYKYGVVPFLLDRKDWVEVGERYSTGEEDMTVYMYYRSKETCDEATRKAREWVMKEFLVPMERARKEENPDLDKYR